jgi:Bacterial toxin 44
LQGLVDKAVANGGTWSSGGGDGERQQPDQQGANPPGIYLNTVGDIIRNTATNDKPNVYMLHNGTPYYLGQIGGIIDIGAIYTNLLEQNIAISARIQDPTTFRNLVTAGGLWDYKTRRTTIFGYVNLVRRNDTKFSFHRQIMEAQDVGNHHFGVVGKASGFPFSEDLMLREAGQAQMRDGTSNPEWQKYRSSPTPTGGRGVMLWPYGDDPRDQGWIQRGFDYWKNRPFQKP